MGCRLTVAVLFCGLLFAGGARAATIHLTSVGYNAVQVIVNGSATYVLGVGQSSPEGVKLKSIADNTAVFEVDGQPVSLRLGQSTQAETLLKADARGQFFVTASINGVGVNAIVDTGATYVSVNSEDARGMGIDYTRGQRIMSRTANGPTAGYIVNFARVQVGDIVLTNVAGHVSEGGRAQLPLVLIGMSFLNHVEMRRSGNTMLLQKRD